MGNSGLGYTSGMSDDLQLFGYWRSSATYRVRIALNLKQLSYEYRPIHLVKDGGEQHGEAYKALNPQELVPTLLHGQTRLTQSLAIIEYLDDVFPDVPLLPADAEQRAAVRAFAMAIACDVTPLGNLRVLQYLKRQGVETEEWSRHWIELTFAALEQTARARDSAFCLGETVSMAECVLVPQMYNARRFGVDVSAYPKLVEIDARCMQMPAFIAASPEMQPDAT